MNIELLARQSLDYLKFKFGNLPNSGIIAGGALANLIWEKVSGNIAVINDIDIFVFENILLKEDSYGNLSTKIKSGEKMFYRSLDKIYWRDYTGFCESSKNKNFYIIERTENKDIFNFIYYSGTSSNTNLVIESFDINCTQIAYNIEEDKFYWTKDFEKFLKTAELKIVNLGSPHHSSIRIIKKRDELKAKLDTVELDILAYTVKKNMLGITRRYFSDKYLKYYQKYEEELSKYYKLLEEPDIAKILNDAKDLNINLYSLECILDDDYFSDIEYVSYHCNDFLFFMRNIEKDTYDYKVWDILNHLYDYQGYIDSHIDDEDLFLLKRITENIPNSISNLKGLKLSQQVNIVKRLLNIFSEDLTIAFALIDNIDIKTFINEEIESDENKLLLELSVRKKIIDNHYNVNAIMGIEPNIENIPF